MNAPLISVVIPVYNGGFWLPDLIPALFEQTIADQCEFIFIDSGSTDNSKEIIAQFPVRLLQINKEDFNHGDTRNFGVQNAFGKFVVMTVQDAVPADKFWIANLMKGFVHEKVAGVCGIQIVKHSNDTNPLAWYKPVNAGKLIVFEFPDFNDFKKLPPAEKIRVCGWDNVTSIYRREQLLQIPFRKISFGEDMAWALDALQNGLAIAHMPEAKVFHHHFETPDYTFKRIFAVAYFRFKLFNYKFKTQSPEWKVRLLIVFRLLRNFDVKWSAKIKWIKYNWMLNAQFKRAIAFFNNELSKGEDQLDKAYRDRCKTPPLAPNPLIYEKV